MDIKTRKRRINELCSRVIKHTCVLIILSLVFLSNFQIDSFQLNRRFISKVPAAIGVGNRHYSSLKLQSTVDPIDVMNDLPPADSVPIVLIAALIIGFTAQSWINFQLNGERGLGSFLSDGSGFKRSAFRPRSGSGDMSDGTAPVSSDPLPWLKLPRLDFVEVAGQEYLPTFTSIEELLDGDGDNYSEQDPTQL